MSDWFHMLGAWGRPKPSKRQALACAALLLGLWMWAGQAKAHLMPAQQGSLHVQGSSVLAMVALPVSALSQVDDDGDGRLSDTEVQAHLDSIKNQVKARFRLFKGDTPGRVEQLQVLAEEDERTPPLASGPTALAPSAGAAYFLMLMKVSFAGAPELLRLETDLFGSAARERQLTLKITRGEDTEAVVLTPWRSTHQLFRSPLKVLQDYTLVGMEHIVLGWDHLTFLLTVLVAASGWGYWLSLIHI